MKNNPYHYTECGLDNIYLLNGFKFRTTSRGSSISIKDLDGLHKAIGLYFVTSKKDLTGQEIRFLRHEMLMSQNTLACLLGVTEQAVHRWENEKTTIPKPSESLLRLLYQEHGNNQHGKIATTLKRIAHMEDTLNDKPIHFADTKDGWKAAA